MRVIRAKFAGTCPECRREFSSGDLITRCWVGWGHLDCVERKEAAAGNALGATRGYKASTYRRRSRRA